jgi:hypothetical protein
VTAFKHKFLLINFKRYLHIILFVAVFAAIASYLLLFSHAAPNDLLGDTNGDNKVDVLDLSILLSNYGKTPAQGQNPNADINKDSVVNIQDLSILLSNYGKLVTTTEFSVAITSPADTATIQGITAWTVNATGTNVQKVEYYIDKQLQWTATSSPYTFARNPGGWDTTKESNNLHNLKVIAYNSAGSTVTATSTVKIKNPVTGGLGLDRSILSANHYASSNVWYKALPVSTPIAANTSTLVNNLISQYKKYYGAVGYNTSSYSPAMYIADANTPRYNFKFYDCQNKGYVDQGLVTQLTNVPIPASANPSPGTDRELSIFDTSTNTLYEMWEGIRVNNQWYACWGGKIANTTTNIGQFTYPYGTTATGLPMLGSTIMVKELQNGVIPHAIAISVVESCSCGPSWPANRHDGWVPAGVDPATLPMQGQRWRLDPNVNVDALNMHPIAKMIAKAAQKYGFVPRDTAGAIVVYGENSQPYIDAGLPSPYDALFNGTPSYAIMNNFPWDKMQILPVDYGKSTNGW